MNKFIVSPSPHTHSPESTQSIMRDVLIALTPAMLVSILASGWSVLALICVSVVACVLLEFLIQKYWLKVPVTVTDLSAAVTGCLLALNLPPNAPWWIAVIGAIVAIGVAKMTFGGLGNNIFNPALVGRCALLVAFPAQMTSWPLPGQWLRYTDAETGATPLELMKQAVKSGNMDMLAQLPDSFSLLFADLSLNGGAGTIGEVCDVALIAGLIFMLWRKIITWHIPVSIIGTVFVLSGLLHLASPVYAEPGVVILSGGLMLGAIFMATDYVTSPMTPKGQLIYGVSIGFLTVVIRNWGAYPEGMSFAILIMNAFTPLINNYVKPKRFGEVPAEK